MFHNKKSGEKVSAKGYVQSLLWEAVNSVESQIDTELTDREKGLAADQLAKLRKRIGKVCGVVEETAESET